jgi:hypothetical protein
MTSRVEAMRSDKIVNYLQGNEAAASDISSDLDIPYVTVRRILSRMEESGRIKQVGYKHGSGGYTYTAIAHDPMVYLTSFGNTVPASVLLNEFLERAKANNRQFNSEGVEQAVHFMAKSLATIFYVAYTMDQEGITDSESLSAARTTLLRCEKTFAEMARLCRQIIDEPAFWEPKLLLNLTKSAMYTSRQVNEAYAIFTES